MLLDSLLARDCVTCPSLLPCSCGPNQTCVQTGRSCTACPINACITNGSSGNSVTTTSTSSSHGVSKGALAGAVIGTLILLAAAVFLFLWYRRNNRLRSVHVPEIKDTPASADTVLNRPDPIEKPATIAERSSVRVYSVSSSTTIDLDPQSQQNSPHPAGYPPTPGSVHSDPFEDNQSIQTVGTEGTNVIPIALVERDTGSIAHSETSGPTRPVRSPELSLNYNLEHINVSGDSMHPRYAASQISGISGVSSYITNASYSSDFLNEAPMIVTVNKGTVRQALVKPEVIMSDGLKTPGFNRPSIRSPLAESSFGPMDKMSIKSGEDGISETDPFSDKHSSTVTNHASPAASVTTFGQPSPPPPNRVSYNSAWEAPPVPPYMKDDNQSRPSSMFTQAGSVIGIENATRVNLGMGYVSDDAQTPGYTLSPYRSTARLTPTSGTTSAGTLQQQQLKAMAQAQARDEGLGRRVSASSVLSAASTRADSILESFPFVPPSPISNRPMRSPPVSPLVQQTFSQASNSLQKPDQDVSDAGLPAPPNRRLLGMSTASQLSTASSGLGSFPFQIDSGSEPPSASYNGRQRASLDTLAITSDLSSYPLGFDRDSSIPYQQN